MPVAQLLYGHLGERGGHRARLRAHHDAPLLLLCSGWKGFFNLEDTLFAGALAELLLQHDYGTNCDATKAAIDLWNVARTDLPAYVEKAAHTERLKGFALEYSIAPCLQIDAYPVLPVFHEGILTNDAALP